MGRSHPPLPKAFERLPMEDKPQSPASSSVAICHQMGNIMHRRNASSGTARTNTRLQFGLGIGSWVMSGPRYVPYRAIKCLGLSTVQPNRIKSTNACHGSYSAAIRWSSSSPEASLVTTIRSIAIQGQKLGKLEIIDAYNKNPVQCTSGILVPLGALVFQSMVETGLGSGKPRKGFVTAYHASISELRQLMEADRERAKPLWTTEERKTFLGILNSLDEMILKLLGFLRKLLYAFLLVMIYFILPSNLGTLRSGPQKVDDQFSDQHHSRPHIGKEGE